MEYWSVVHGAADVALAELALFAAIGFALVGASDLLVDLIWIGLTSWRRLVVYRRHPRACAVSLAPAARPGRLAVFIPAWDESPVIGHMLARAVSVWSGPHRLYVGCYANDPGTIAAVRAVDDPRVRPVIVEADGPTTKADCLNALWRAMLADEAEDGAPFKAVVLHDAEDVVHPAELAIFDRLIETFDLVQLPVVPLPDPRSRWIAGSYLDEFAESHGKEMVVREALGAGLPSAGVGCAFRREALVSAAAGRADGPFDADSLTEDYELGLRLRARGGRAAFVRLPAAAGLPAVATREHFPATLDAAVAQKARWMAGIALSGWDRLGWNGGLAERWMRLRDRQAPIAALLLVAGYAALLLGSLLLLVHWLGGPAPSPPGPILTILLGVNAFLLVWRLGMRAGFVARLHGWREGVRAVPRLVVGNAIAMMAARRALVRYLAARREGRPRWEKTVHVFPDHVA